MRAIPAKRLRRTGGGRYARRAGLRSSAFAAETGLAAGSVGEKKRRAARASRRPHCFEAVPLGPANARGLQALRPTGDLELDALTFGQSLETLALDGREVHEHVLAAFLRDETKTLGLVEPLHGTTSHVQLL